MGLLSTLSSSVKSITATPTAIVKTLASGAGVKAAISAGMQSEKAYISELKANPIKAVGERVLGPQVIMTATAGAILAAPKVGAAALTAAKAKPLAAAAAVPIGITAASTLVSSEKARTAAAEVVNPTNYASFGSNIGKAIDNPSWENVKKIATESPYLTAATAAGAALLVGKVTRTVATIANTKAIKEANELMSNPITSTPLQGVTSGQAKPLDKISTLAGADTPAAVSVSKPKKQGAKRKQGKRKAKVYKCGHIRRIQHGCATKCYNFY